MASHRESGVTLYEALLGTAFMAGAVLVMFGLYKIVSANWKDNQALDMLGTIRIVIDSAHDRPYYGREGTDLVPLLAAFKAFPEQTFDASGRLRHPWGGLVSVVSMESRFRVIFNNVPGSGCQQLAKAFEKRDNEFISFDANGKELISAEDVIAPWTVPCKDGRNTLAWEFGIPARTAAVAAAPASAPPAPAPPPGGVSDPPPPAIPDNCSALGPSYDAAMLLLDDSSSMNNSSVTGKGTRWEEAVNALQQLAAAPGPSSLSVTTMTKKSCSESGGQPACGAALTPAPLSTETIPAYSEGSSKIYDTVFLAARLLAAGGLGTEKPAAIVVYSDGMDNKNGISLDTLTAYLKANHPRLTVNVVDVSGKTPDFRKLADETGGQYALTDENTDMADLFRNLSGGCGGG